MYYGTFEVLKAEHEALERLFDAPQDDDFIIANIARGIVLMTDAILTNEKEGGS